MKRIVLTGGGTAGHVSPNQALIQTLQKDCEALENETLFASADRYMALIYPEFTTAAAYLSQEAVVAFCDPDGH